MSSHIEQKQNCIPLYTTDTKLYLNQYVIYVCICIDKVYFGAYSLCFKMILFHIPNKCKQSSEYQKKIKNKQTKASNESRNHRVIIITIMEVENPTQKPNKKNKKKTKHYQICETGLNSLNNSLSFFFSL